MPEAEYAADGAIAAACFRSLGLRTTRYTLRGNANGAICKN